MLGGGTHGLSHWSIHDLLTTNHVANLDMRLKVIMMHLFTPILSDSQQSLHMEPCFLVSFSCPVSVGRIEFSSSKQDTEIMRNHNETFSDTELTWEPTTRTARVKNALAVISKFSRDAVVFIRGLSKEKNAYFMRQLLIGRRTLLYANQPHFLCYKSQSCLQVKKKLAKNACIS